MCAVSHATVRRPSPWPACSPVALDVTDPEPLPAGHPLWEAQGFLVTPHIAGGATAMLPRMAALARDKVERYVAGRELRNVVHRPE
jgi:phosphoglycerate dehydrogenase-like enzyme